MLPSNQEKTEENLPTYCANQVDRYASSDSVISNNYSKPNSWFSSCHSKYKERKDLPVYIVKIDRE